MTFTPLSPDELAWMTRDETASLTDRCTIQRKSGAVVNGSPSKAGATYTNLYTNVPCRVTYRKLSSTGPDADEQLVALQEAQINVWTLIVALGTDLAANDRVIGSDGAAYLVLGTSKVRTNNTKLTAYLREVGATP